MSQAHLQIIRNTRKFLERTPISGAEAESMITCRNWLLALERSMIKPPPALPTPAPQVDGSIEK